MKNAEKFWDRMADSFDREEGELDPDELELIERVKAHLQTDDVVLDYGCATGNITLRIAPQVARIQGIDISGEMIAAAQEKARQNAGENTTFMQATISDPRLAPGSFDAVLALNILHLLPEPEQALQRIHDLLMPGGRLVSTTACMGENRFSLVGLSLRAASALRVIPPLHFFKTAELEEIITRANFEIREADSRLDPENKATIHFVAARKV